MGIINFDGNKALISTARDITERKLTQRKLENIYQAEKELRNSLQGEIEKRSKYTRALVHELNTPLTSILASGELLESEVRDPPSAILVQNIRQSSFSLKQRIDELLELARGETGLLKINAMPINISGILLDIEHEMQPLVKQKGLEMQVKVEENLPLAMGDEVRLRSVIFNLISNAMNYTDRGTIEVDMKQAGEFIEVSVKDNGKGISPQELQNLFDPYQKKPAENQSQGGLGIGLTLSKMFIELHGGHIDTASEFGKGSTFRFTVPLYREADLIRKFSQKSA
jgi:signal transduction histidine kinase